MLNINNEMSKSDITFNPIQNKSVFVHVCFVLFIVCLFICECLIQNNNHNSKHKNNVNCGSAFEPGASGLPHYCNSICVRSWCNWRASCVDSKPKKKRGLQTNKLCGGIIKTQTNKQACHVVLHPLRPNVNTLTLLVRTSFSVVNQF